MNKPFSFSIQKMLKKQRTSSSDMLGRAGILSTPHGDIETPAFIAVGTKGTVKALTTEQLKEIGVQAVICNTYHLYLQPGKEVVSQAGGVHNFMQWFGPTMTDSGGFQVFSLGDAYGTSVSKFAHDLEESDKPTIYDQNFSLGQARLARIDEEGVTFTSHIDGSTHRFTAERSIEIQHDLGADVIFAFDECTSPSAPYEYQKEALARTQRWAERSLKSHRQNPEVQRKQALFGIVQGGRFEDLRKESATIMGAMDFDGYGIGGSFSKKDLDASLQLVDNILPEEKPRHLLGIGEPEDLFGGIENGVDTFDCVSPTRIARNGTLYNHQGKINILNTKYIRDFTPVSEQCECSVCKQYTKAYLAHLFRAREMLGATLASFHNLYFIVKLVKNIRQSILDEQYHVFKTEFLSKYGI